MPLNCVGYSSPALSGEIKLPARYSDISYIGQGASCVVLKAHDSFLDRSVAIKFIKPELNDFTSVRRFQQEAKVMSAFRLNHLPVVLDFGLSPCGRPYMVMELVEGTALSDILAARGTLSVDLTIEITIQMLTALEHAHERGIIHRDLKSHNVMVSWTTEGKPLAKVVDFGLACGINRPGYITAVGAALGTPLYMSPEQAQGKHTDARTDIYSLGCVVFEMLTGATPFVGASMTETLDAHIRTIAPSLGSKAYIENDMLADLECIVAKCLEKDPEKRYRSAAELRSVLFELAEKMRLDEAERLRHLLRSASVSGTRHSTSMTKLKAIQPQTHSSSTEAEEDVFSIYSWRETGKDIRGVKPLAGRTEERYAGCQQNIRLRVVLPAMALVLMLALAILVFDQDMFTFEKLPIEIGDLTVDASKSDKPFDGNSEQNIREHYFGNSRSAIYSTFHITGKEFFALPQTSDADLARLKNFPAVTAVNLVAAQNITGRGFNAIKELPIERLDVRSLPVTQSGFKAISQMPNLSHLRIDYVPFVTTSKLACLQQAPALKQLTMRGLPLRKENLAVIARLPHLESLAIERCTEVESSTLQTLATIKSLRKLWISQEKFSEKSVRDFVRTRPDVKLMRQ
jgi:serine/threonine protein kinase